MHGDGSRRLVQFVDDLEQEAGCQCSKATREIVKCKLDSWGKALGLQRAGSWLSLSTKPQREVIAKDGTEHK